MGNLLYVSQLIEVAETVVLVIVGGTLVIIAGAALAYLAGLYDPTFR